MIINATNWSVFSPLIRSDNRALSAAESSQPDTPHATAQPDVKTPPQLVEEATPTPAQCVQSAQAS